MQANSASVCADYKRLDAIDALIRKFAKVFYLIELPVIRTNVKVFRHSAQYSDHLTEIVPVNLDPPEVMNECVHCG